MFVAGLRNQSSYHRGHLRGGRDVEDDVRDGVRGLVAEEGLYARGGAAELAPDDPAIKDSLGWVHYRLGNLELAETLLREAYDAFPDQEVAAHLGEVLWRQGKERQARRIWRDALKLDPQSPLIPETRKRLEAE